MSTSSQKLFNIGLDGNNDRQYLYMYRGMSIAGAVIYPMFYFLFNDTATPYPTPVYEPFIFTIACGLFLLGTFYSEYVRKNVSRFALVLYYGFTIDSLADIVLGSFDPQFFFGLIVVITIFSVAMTRKNDLVAYSLFTFLAFGAINFSMNRPNDALLYQADVGAMFLIFHIILANKIKLREDTSIKAELMYKLFNNSPDAILFYDIEKMEIVNCNEKALDLFQYPSKEKLITNPISCFFSNDVPSEHFKDLFQAYNSAKSFYGEEKLMTYNGKEFWADLALNEFRVGRHKYIVARIQDVDIVKNANATVRKSEEKYRDLIESSKDLICIHDLSGKILSANPAFGYILGYKPEKVIGTYMTDYIPEEHRGEFFKYMDELVDEGTKEGIMKAVDIHGNIKLLEYRNTVKPGENGEPLIRGMAVDVTEKFNLQQQLIKREERYRLISENSCDIICQHSKTGIYEYVSFSVARMLGYAPEEMMTRDPMDFINPDDKKLYKLLSPFYTDQIDIEPISLEYRLKHKNGRDVWINTIFKPLLNKHLEVMGYHSYSRDISDRKKNEALQEKKDKLFKALTEASKELLSNPNINEGIHHAFKILGNTIGVDRIYCFENTTDKTGNIYYNHRFEWSKENNAFFTSNPEVQNIPYADTLPRWLEILQQGTIIKGMTDDFPEPERTLIRKNDTKSVLVIPIIIAGKMWGFLSFDHCVQKHFWSGIEEAVLKTAAAGITGYIGRIMNEKDLMNAKEEAESASQAKETFLANVSHEIRTPMNGIIGLVQLMQKTHLDETQKKYIQAIKQSGEFLVVIINDLLDLSKIVAGHMEFEHIPFDLNGIIININQTYGARAIDKGINLKLDIDPMIPRQIKGDPVRLNQILVNLIGNSIKFTEQGHVLVQVKLLGQTGEHVKLGFTICDTGIGIAEEKKSLIFESYKQAGTDTSRKYGGTGLGLSIVKKLIEAQNSNIHVESIPGEGSKFMFELDFEIATQEIVASEQQEEFISLKGVKILLAEDNMVNQLLANDLITSWGASLVIVENGELAIQKLKAGKFDIVLMDVQMPVLGGLEATEVIRNFKDNEEIKNIPIIAMTADAVKQNVEKCFKAGMTAHITKPFIAHELNQIIWNNILEEKKNALQNATKNEEVQSVEHPVEQNSTTYQYISLKNLLEFSRGKNDFIIKMLKLLIEQTPPAVEGIEDGIKNSNWEDVRALAHKMKPNINLLGNPELDRMILKIEKDTDGKTELEQVPAVFDSFKTLYVKAMAELNNALKDYSKAA